MEGNRSDATRAPGPGVEATPESWACQPPLPPAEGLSGTNRELRPAPPAPAAHGSTANGPRAPRYRRRGRAAPPAMTSPSHPSSGKADPFTRAQWCGIASRRYNHWPYPFGTKRRRTCEALAPRNTIRASRWVEELYFGLDWTAVFSAPPLRLHIRG
jgi:hypothetical protein